MCHFIPPVDSDGTTMSHSLPPEILDLIAERFRVLAEPARLRILNVLLNGERTVSDLVDETGLHQANVSKHLSLLRSSNFVDRRKEGLYAYNGIFVPSYAHDDTMMDRALASVGRVLEKVADADRRDELDRRIEIPIVSFYAPEPGTRQRRRGPE